MWNYGGIIMKQNNGILMEFQLRIYQVKYRQHENLTFPLHGNLMEFFITAFPLHGIR